MSHKTDLCPLSTFSFSVQNSLKFPRLSFLLYSFVLSSFYPFLFVTFHFFFLFLLHSVFFSLTVVISHQFPHSPFFLLPVFFLFILNLLKPTGHVMHQQFNIQQLYALPTLYLCVLYLSENKQRLVPLTA